MPARFLVDGEAADRVPAADRGLAYGDGLFTTAVARRGRVEFWLDHVQRLHTGAAALGFTPPDKAALEADLTALLGSEADERRVVRITLTRGSGGRGYAPPERAAPRRIVSLAPWPEHGDRWRESGVRVTLSEVVLSQSPALGGVKHLNRLPQVLARQALGEGWDEALMANQANHWVGGTASNLFLVMAEGLVTPPTTPDGVTGIARSRVLALAEALGMPCVERAVSATDLAEAKEAFLTNCVAGIAPIREWTAGEIGIGERTRSLQTAFEAARRAPDR